MYVMANLFTLVNATSNSESITTLLSQLPKRKWMGDYDLYLWQGSWYFPAHIETTLALQSNFQPLDHDIIITSPPKAGTTWLKALLHTILHDDDDDHDPLLKNNPHSLVQSLECQIYMMNKSPHLSTTFPSPRIFHSHLPYHALPDSIKNSKCKIVYIARNPKDTFVSLYHFINTLTSPQHQRPYPINQAFDDFCNGVHFFGPYLDHVLEYWNESLSNPKKIQFFKYEDLKREPKQNVTKLAEFIHKPFSSDEEVDKVLWRCSIERLKNLEVNRSGSFPFGLSHSSYFRLGVVGDWNNYFTKEMSERLDQLTRSKLEGSGLELEM